MYVGKTKKEIFMMTNSGQLETHLGNTRARRLSERIQTLAPLLKNLERWKECVIVKKYLHQLNPSRVSSLGQEFRKVCLQALREF